MSSFHMKGRPGHTETGSQRLRELRDRLGELLPLVEELLDAGAKAPEVRETVGAYAAGGRFRVEKA
jgi:hypothetical protein